MKEINDMMDGAKVLYNPFTEFVCDCSLKEFLVKFRYPFLVGQDLYQGELRDKTIQGYNPTFRFQGELEQENALHDISSLHKSLFMLRPLYQNAISTIFNIGRTDGNDIVIVDYSISKEHAQIVVENGRYLLSDKGTTNGSFVNDVNLDVDEQKEIKRKDHIVFGRIGFMILKPIDVFIKTRLYTGREDSLEKEVLQLARKIKRSAIENIAERFEVDVEERSKEELVRILLSRCSAKKLLELIF